MVLDAEDVKVYGNEEVLGDEHLRNLAAILGLQTIGLYTR
jgi:hypothetical protein